MNAPRVVVIGGGATGIGILRDLSMRGIPAVLLEQGGLAHGTSSRFHGLLHSGARYVVSDNAAARECLEENTILRRIGKQCVETTEGFFALTPHDDPAYVTAWLKGCATAGISAEALAVREALTLERNLAPNISCVYRVPDSCVDGFRLVWHNAMSARSYGGEVRTYHTVTGIEQQNGAICGVHARNTINGENIVIPCEFVVNAAGSWSGIIARMAGLEVQVAPDRGTLVVFNHRFTSRVINRLHKSADGDIFVPHGSITILGTTSTPTDSPSNTTPTTEEVLRLLKLGTALFPHLESYRILRAFAGTRPLYSPQAGAGRAASRNFHIVDHHTEGLQGMASIFGGKLTTYRLMAEKMTDLICHHLRHNSPCRSADEDLVPAPSPQSLRKAAHYFPLHGVNLVAERLGQAFEQVVEKAALAPSNELLCECEMVSMAEVEYVAADPTTHYLSDIRLRTRLGMGTCQGTFCSLRAMGALTAHKLPLALSPTATVRGFMQERWRGLRPALWGTQLQEIELGRAIYAATLNLDGAQHEQNS
ncbi:MAG: anaerobic glycerol-3-phosphate dehydrogenase subunit GlpA [Desulfovibrionaceae bacterium]